MKLEQLLASENKVFDNAVLQAAVDKSKAAKVERLTGYCVNVLEASDATVTSHVAAIRSYRKEEKNQKDALAAVTRAQNYLKKTGNPIPLMQIVQGHYTVNDFCSQLGLELPDADARVVPKDWVDTEAETETAE